MTLSMLSFRSTTIFQLPLHWSVPKKRSPLSSVAEPSSIAKNGMANGPERPVRLSRTSFPASRTVWAICPSAAQYPWR